MVVENVTGVIEWFFQASIFGFPVWLAVGLIVYVISEFYKPPKEEQYRKISLVKEVRRELNELFKTSEETIGQDKTLSIGPVRVGSILKMINLNKGNKIFTKLKKKKKKEPKEKEEKETKEIKKEEKPKKKPKEQPNFYGFKVVKNDIVSKLMAQILNKGYKVYLVEQSLCSIGPMDIVITPYSQYDNFIDVMIFSEAGKEIIMDIAYKLTLENTLEEMVNYVPKMSFLDSQQSKFAGRVDKMSDLEKQKYKDRLKSILDN